MWSNCSHFFVIPSVVEESLAKSEDSSTSLDMTKTGKMFAVGSLTGTERRFEMWHSFVIRASSFSSFLLRDVENAATLLAAHNLVPTFGVHRGGRRHFHVTSGTNTVLDRDHGCVTFARE